MVSISGPNAPYFLFIRSHLKVFIFLGISYFWILSEIHIWSVQEICLQNDRSPG